MHPLVPLLLAVAAVPGTACRAQRTLTIDSEPPGAQVRLDEDIVGETPVTVSFEHYGTRRVTLSKEGYRTVSRRVAVEAPLYGRFPLDLASEVLFPVGWEDHHRVFLRLAPGVDAVPAPDLRSVLARAEALRRAGPEGPRILPPVRPAPIETLPAEAALGDPEAAGTAAPLPRPPDETEGTGRSPAGP